MPVVAVLLLVACAGAPAREVAREGAGSARPTAPAPMRAEAPEPGATPPADAEPEPQLELVATVLPDRVTVAMSLPVGWIGGDVRGVQVTFGEAPPFADGTRGFEGFVVEIDESGAERPFDGAFAVEDGVARGGWSVRLRHHQAGPIRGIDEVPRPTRGGWALAGRAFVPRELRLADGRRLELDTRLRLVVPDGHEVVASAPPHASSPRTFVAGSLADLSDAVYVTGRFSRREVRVAGARVTLVTSDFDEPVLGDVERLVRSVLRLGAERLGPLPPSDRMIVVDLNPQGIDGGVIGRAITVLSASRPDHRATSDAGVVLTHELMHLWNRSDTWWVNEGLTRWLEVAIKAEADGIQPEDADDEIARVFEAYLERAGERPVAESEGEWGYAAGAVLAFCADERLRAHGSSLAAAHRAARARTEQRRSETVAAAILLEEIDRLHAETGAQVRRLLSAREPIALERCHRPTRTLRIRSYRGFSEQGLRAVLGIDSHARYSTRIFGAPLSNPLDADDVILRVNGEPVRDMRGVDAALHDVRPGRDFTLEVRRAATGANETVTLTMPDLAPTLREDHRRVGFTRSERRRPGAGGRPTSSGSASPPSRSGSR